MTPEQRALILQLADEYGDSLERSDNERNQRKAIVARAQKECTIKPARFDALAKARYNDTVTLQRSEYSAMADLFALVIGEAP